MNWLRFITSILRRLSPLEAGTWRGTWNQDGFEIMDCKMTFDAKQGYVLLTHGRESHGLPYAISDPGWRNQIRMTTIVWSSERQEKGHLEIDMSIDINHRPHLMAGRGTLTYGDDVPIKLGIAARRV